MATQYLDAPPPDLFATWLTSDFIVGANWLSSEGGTSEFYRLTRSPWDLSRYALCVTANTGNVTENVLESRAAPPSPSLEPWVLRAVIRTKGVVDITMQVREAGTGGGVSVSQFYNDIDSPTWTLLEYELTPTEVGDLSTVGGDLSLRMWPRSAGGGEVALRLAGIWLEAGEGAARAQAVEAASAEDVQVLSPPLLEVTVSAIEPVDLAVSKVISPPLLTVAAADVAHLITGESAVSFPGIVDDVQIYSSPQDDDEEARVAMGEATGEEADLVDYFKFSTGTGAAVYGENGGTGSLGGWADWVGFEGTPELAGTRKPRTMGVAMQREGTLVDGQRLVYQVNVGETGRIAPTEGGLESLTYQGDQVNIYDVEPDPGSYTTQLSDGLVRLQAELPGLAFNVEGVARTDHGEGGFSAVPAVIIRRILQHDAGVGLGDILLASLDLLAVQSPGPIGYCTGPAPVKISEALSYICSGIDAWWQMNPRGKFNAGLRAEVASRMGSSVGRVGGKKLLTTKQPSIAFWLTDDDLESRGPSRLKAREVASSWTLRHSRYQVEIALEDVTGSIPAGERGGFTREWRTVRRALGLTEAYRGEFPEAVARDADTVHYDAARAGVEASRMLAVDRYPRDFVKFPTRLQEFRIPATVGAMFVYQGVLAPEGRVYFVAGVHRDPAGARLTITGWTTAEGYGEVAWGAAGEVTYLPPGTAIAGAAGRWKG
jgi:hypothetical protein